MNHHVMFAQMSGINLRVLSNSFPIHVFQETMLHAIGEKTLYSSCFMPGKKTFENNMLSLG
jgi:hypothetical protein